MICTQRRHERYRRVYRRVFNVTAYFDVTFECLELIDLRLIGFDGEGAYMGVEENLMGPMEELSSSLKAPSFT